MTDAQKRFRLGIFVLICLGLLGVLAFFFGGISSWFIHKNKYTIVFSDAPGVGNGTPIRRSGVRIGEVNGLDLDSNTGEVRVYISLDNKYIPRASEEPHINRGFIVGDTSIDFIPKNLDKQGLGDPIESGSEIRGVSPLYARMLINSATDLIPEAQLSLHQIRASLQNVEKILPQFQNTLKEIGDLARSAREVVPGITRSVDEIRDVLGNAKGIGTEIQGITQDVRKFVNTTTKTVDDISQIIKKNEPKIAAAIDTGTKTIEKVGQLLSDDNQKQFQMILANIQKASLQIEPLTIQAQELLKSGKTSLDDLSKNSKVWFERIMKDLHEQLKPVQEAIADGREIIGDVKKVTQALSEKTTSILKNVEVGSDQFARSIMDVREIMRSVAQSDGNLQKFLTDSTLYSSLVDTIRGVNKSIPRLDRILQDIEVFADKIARHPESIGVGGAVRPSAGLKEAPSSNNRKQYP